LPLTAQLLQQEAWQSRLWSVDVAQSGINSVADFRPRTRHHIGETATVCGVVTSAMLEASAQDQPRLLDLAQPSPHAIFTAVIHGDHRSKFGTPETALRAKRICVTGQISDYRRKPEIGVRPQLS